MATLDGNYIDPMNVSARQTGIRWGLIWGLISSLLMILTHFAGLDTINGKNTFLLLIPTLATIGGIIFCISSAQKQHRDEELGGYMTLSRGVLVGLWVGLISGAIVLVFAFFFYSFIAKDFFENMTDGMVQQMEQLGQDGDKVRTQLEESKWRYSPGMLAIQSFFVKTIGGLFWGLIVGLFTKRESNKPF